MPCLLLWWEVLWLMSNFTFDFRLSFLFLLNISLSECNFMGVSHRACSGGTCSRASEFLAGLLWYGFAVTSDPQVNVEWWSFFLSSFSGGSMVSAFLFKVRCSLAQLQLETCTTGWCASMSLLVLTTPYENTWRMGLPWWSSGGESACQCRGHGFNPWSQN